MAICSPGLVEEEANPEENAEMIGKALESSFVFRGIDKRRLQEVSFANCPSSSFHFHSTSWHNVKVVRKSSYILEVLRVCQREC